MQEETITQIDRVCPGQVFTDDGETIAIWKCWMVICRVEDEHGIIEYSIFPLMPTRKERRQFITLSSNYDFDPEFLDRHNDVFMITGTTLQEFLEKMPEFDRDDELEDVFNHIAASVTTYQSNGDSVGEPFGRHLYLATIPTSARERSILFLEFDDNAYYPKTHIAPLGGDRIATYRDFVHTSRSWRRLPVDMVEEIFRGVDDATISVLNDGLNGLSYLSRQILAEEKIEDYKLMNHLEELSIVPTIWRFNNVAEVRYDLWGDWETNLKNGDVYVDLSEIRIRHKANTNGVGLLGQRQPA